MNIITTVGYLTADPTLSATNSGQQVCKFRLGSQNRRRDENNNFMTNFYNCTVWGKTGETIARLFKKGNRIMVSGDLTIRDYTDKNGAARVSIDIDVRDWDFGERSNGGQAQAQTQAPQVRPQVPQVQYQVPVAQPQYGYTATAAPQYAAPAPVQPVYQPQAQPQAPAPQTFTPVEDDSLPF